MSNLELDIDNIKKKFAKNFLLSFAGILLFYIIVYYVTEFYDLKFFVVQESFLFISFLLCLYTYYILSKAHYNFTAVFSIIFFLIFFLITYLSLILSVISETILIFYLPLTALFLILFDYRKSVLFCIFVILLCYNMPYLSGLTGFDKYRLHYHHNEEGLKFQEYLTITVSTFYTFFILYYYKKITEVRIRHSSKVLYIQNGNHSKTNEKPSSYSANQTDALQTEHQKFRHLYEDIIIFFEQEKPFQDPNFNIRQLAENVGSNTTYVSAALNKTGNKKFNQMVNEYRINQVLNDLNNGLHHKFTIEHIYKTAGFSQQSTFNRIFKEQTEVTPSEYIEKLKQNNSQQPTL